MSDKYFLVNKLSSSLTIKQGYTTIPPFGYVKITAVEANDPTVLYALGRDWAEITSSEPESAADTKAVSVDITSPYGGMTEEELKMSKAQEPTEPAITTALGRDPMFTGGATGTPIGQDTTVEVKPEPVKHKKKAT